MEEDSKKKLPVPGKAKVGVKRIKKKPNLNISKGNLKSVNTPKKFNFLNMSVQKQSLRANNRALARNLSNARLELRNLSAEHQELKVAYQDAIQQSSRLKRLVGIKDDEIEEEVQKRMQIQIKQMKSVLEELTENMFKSSVIINMLNGKFTSLSRQSSASSRAASLSNDSIVADGSQNRLSLTQRGTSATRNKKPSAMMMDFLSNADEFSPPPFADSPPFHAEKANMSVIAEQSFLADDFTSYKPLLPVSENPRGVGNKKIKPAQRVLIEKKTLKGTNDVVPEEKDKTVSAIAENIRDKKVVDQKTMKEMSPNNKRMNILPVDEIAASEDLELGILDISSDFTHLVSGSPISTGRKEDTSDKLEGNAVNKQLPDKDKTRRQAIVVGKEHKQLDDIKKNTSKTILKTSKLAKYKSGSKLNKESGKVKSASSVKYQASLNQETPLRISSNQDSFNPFKPTNVLLRSPPPCTNHNPGNEGSPAIPQVKINSTHFLSSLNSSDKISCQMLTLPSNDTAAEQSAFGDEHTMYFNSEMELTAVNDIGKLLQASHLLSSRQSPSVQMDDQTVEKLDKDSDLKVKNKAGKRTDKSNDNVTEKKDKPSKKEKVVEQHDISEEAAATVEMRNKKPGIFTFAVSRKEADGTRKAVPEKTSRARSKKARAVTPEKDKKQEGDDRDMFNFGDRTPTVPLEKLLQSKSVYDISMNESSIAPTSGYSNFKQNMEKTSDIRETNLETQRQNEHIYTVPLKDHSDEKKETKSKGRSRSKSKSRRASASDDEWVPEKKARSRSRGGASNKKTSLDKEMENESGPGLKTTDAEHYEYQTYNVPLVDSPGAKKDITSKGRSRSKSNTRSKSKSRRGEESDDEVVPERMARSRSRGRLGEKKTSSGQIVNGDEKTNCTEFEKANDPTTISETVCQIYEVPLKDSSEAKKELNSKGRSRSKSNTRSKSKSRRGEESDDEVVPERMARSRSRGRQSERKASLEQIANGDEKTNDLPIISQTDCKIYEVPLKDSSEAKKELNSKGRSRSKSNTRSKSKSRRGEESDDEVVPERMARSRSRGRRSEKETSLGQIANGDEKTNCTEFEKSNNPSIINQTDCKIYEVPLKDSSEAKKELNSKGCSRSKSNTRSKSKSRRGEESDDEVVPERMARSRSRGRRSEKETSLGQIANGDEKTNCTEFEKSNDSSTISQTDCKIYEVPLKDSSQVKKELNSKGRSRSKSNTRSKSKSRRGEESDDEVVPERMSRSRGRLSEKRSLSGKKADDDVKPDCSEPKKGDSSSTINHTDSQVYHLALKDSPKVKKEFGLKDRSRSKSKTRQENHSEIESEPERKSRSRSKKVYQKELDATDESGINNIDQSKHPVLSGEQEMEGDEHEEPLKDSPDVKPKSRGNRSKSRTRSKAKPIVFSESDDDDDVHVKPSVSLEKDLSKKSQSMEGKTVNSTVGDKEKEMCHEEKNENIHSVPLNSIQMSNVSGSKPRSRSNLVNDSDEEANAVTISRSRSKTSQQKDVEKQDKDEQETHGDLARRSARSRSLKQVNHNEKDSVESVSEYNEKAEGNNCDSDIHNTGDSVGSQSTKTKDRTGSKVDSSPYSVGLYERFDQSNINKRSRLKRQIITNKVDDDSDEEVIKKVNSKSTRKTSNKKKIIDDLDSESDFELNIKEKDTLKKNKSSKDKKFKSVTEVRRKSAKLNETFEISDDELDTELQDISDSCKGVKTSEYTKESNFKDTESIEVKKNTKTPKAGSSATVKSTRKINERTVTKSKRKDGDKLMKDVEIKSKSSRTLLLESERSEKDPSLSRQNTKTPAVSKSSGSLKSTKSTVSKSNRKRAVDSKDVEQTPRLKKEKQDLSEQKENSPSEWNSLEMLKKRLTMLSSKQPPLDSIESNVVRKRSAGIEKENLKDEPAEDGAKRSCRAKGPINYVVKPLNAKMRQGDSSLVASEAKAKAQMMRLQLAKRTGVMKDAGIQEKS